VKAGGSEGRGRALASRRPLALSALLLAAGAAGACGVGDKQQRATVITSAPAKAVAAGSGAGTITIEAKPKSSTSAVQSRTPAAGALAGLAAAGQTVTVPVRFDFAKGRADIVLALPAKAPEPEPEPATPAPGAAVPAEGEATPPTTLLAEPAAPVDPNASTAMFQGDTAFVKRVNRRPAERRVWARLDFGGLPSDERAPDQSDLSAADRLSSFANTINPKYLLDLAEGTLAGSVELVGTEPVAGVSTRHYRANMSIDKATTELDLSDDQVETFQHVFQLVGVRGDVHKAEYWVDDEGRLRRSRFSFEQRLLPRIHNIVTVTLELAQYGEPVDVVAPTKDETVRVDRYGRFVRAALPRNS
jgi:hypothetical protein